MIPLGVLPSLKEELSIEGSSPGLYCPSPTRTLCSNYKRDSWLCGIDTYYASDTKAAIEYLELPGKPKPVPKPMLGEYKIVDEYMTQRNWLKQNMKTTYSIIWGQC